MFSKGIVGMSLSMTNFWLIIELVVPESRRALIEYSSRVSGRVRRSFISIFFLPFRGAGLGVSFVDGCASTSIALTWLVVFAVTLGLLQSREICPNFPQLKHLNFFFCLCLSICMGSPTPA